MRILHILQHDPPRRGGWGHASPHTHTLYWQENVVLWDRSVRPARTRARTGPRMTPPIYWQETTILWGA